MTTKIYYQISLLSEKQSLFSLFWPIFNFTYRSKLYICSQFMLKQIKSIRAKLDKFIFSVHPFNPCFVDKDKLR